MVRLESLAESVAQAGTEPRAYAAAFGALLADRVRGAVAVKSVLAYRAGFDVDLSRPSDAQVERHVAAWLREVGRTGSVRLTDPRLIAFGIHEAIGLALPLQLHVGLGDRDMDLRRSDPLLLTDFLRMPECRACRSCCCTATRSSDRPATSRRPSATSSSTSGCR